MWGNLIFTLNVYGWLRQNSIGHSDFTSHVNCWGPGKVLEVTRNSGRLLRGKQNKRLRNIEWIGRNRQFSHLFIGWKGPCDNKTLSTHVLNSRASLGTSGNKMADKHPPRQVAFRSFDHAVIFRRRPQSRRRIEPNVKEENDAWKYHFKWRNSREKLEGKVKTWMVDVAIQCLTKI